MIGLIDYTTMVSWWTTHNFPVLPRSVLPDTGFMYYEDTKPICGVYMYLAQTGGLALCEYWTANPEATSEEKNVGFPKLLTFIKDYAKTQNISMLYTGISNKSLIQRLEKEHWHAVDTSITQMLQYINVPELQKEE